MAFVHFRDLYVPQNDSHYNETQKDRRHIFCTGNLRQTIFWKNKYLKSSSYAHYCIYDEDILYTSLERILG